MAQYTKYMVVWTIHQKLLLPKRIMRNLKKNMNLLEPNYYRYLFTIQSYFLDIMLVNENIKEILKTIFTYVEPNSPSANKIRRNFYS